MVVLAKCALSVGSSYKRSSSRPLSWPTFSTISSVPLTMLPIAWYNNLILAIAAVAIGMQQSVFLVRLGCLSNSDILIRELLSFESPSGLRVPRHSQVLVWQTAVGVLECSIYFWLEVLLCLFGTRLA